MTSATSRREVFRALLATSVGDTFPILRRYGIGAELTVGGAEQHDFARVRQQIRLEFQAAKPTGGVALAVVHKGRLVWTEGFGFADRERRIQATDVVHERQRI